MIADNLQDAATLREALIKVGKERLSVFKQGSSRNELVPYARYISRSLTRDKDVKSPISSLISPGVIRPPP